MGVIGNIRVRSSFFEHAELSDRVPQQEHTEILYSIQDAQWYLPTNAKPQVGVTRIVR
jgi:hypothetical protein